MNKSSYKYFCTALCVGMFSLLLGKYLSVELLGHEVNVYLILFKKKKKHPSQSTAKPLPECLNHLIPPSTIYKNQWLHLLTKTWYGPSFKFETSSKASYPHLQGVAFWDFYWMFLIFNKVSLPCPNRTQMSSKPVWAPIVLLSLVVILCLASQGLALLWINDQPKTQGDP